MWTLRGAYYIKRIDKLILTWLYLYSFCLTESHGNEQLGDDYDCLISFKTAVQDPQNVLLSWNAASPAMHHRRLPPCNGSISSWNGVICDNNRVFSLILPGAGLSGAISANLSKCVAMGTVDLSANQLGGEIPSKLGEMANLVSLNLSGNELTGEIPPELSHCSYLNTLDLHGNQLVGLIPAELGNLARLQQLDVSYNGLSGPIPTTISYTMSGHGRFNASSFEGNKELYGYPLAEYGTTPHTLSLLEIIGIGLASAIFSLTVSFTAVCLWLKISEQGRAAEEGKISDLVIKP